jgi:2-methylcitrate dehydratase PrpD
VAAASAAVAGLINLEPEQLAAAISIDAHGNDNGP